MACFRGILCVALLGAGACSALGLDQFERCDLLGETPAEQAAQCALALNAQLDAPAGCRPYQCIDGECVLNDSERCDGDDNDCDGVVDEDVFAPSSFTGVPYVETASGLSIAADASGGADAYWATSSAMVFNDATSAALSPVAAAEGMALRYRTNAEPGGPMALPAADESLVEGCWEKTIDTTRSLASLTPRRATCRFRALEAERSGPDVFGVSLDTSQCSAGVLHVGQIDDGAFLQVGPLARSNSFMGLGLTPDGTCSAADALECQAALDAQTPSTMDRCASSAECAGGQCLCGQCYSPERAAAARACGFAAFSTASIGSDSRVLIAALSGSYSATRCRMEDIDGTPDDESLRDVVLFGAALRSQQDFTTVNAAAEGEGLVLSPRTPSAGKPALLSLGERVVVAYPAPEGRLAVHFVSAFGQSGDVDIGDCDEAPGGEAICADRARPVCEQTACGSDIGVCVSGSRQCALGQPYCAGARLPDSAEECGNGLDDDCDGRVDEGECAADRAPLATAEQCNGSDDDFDGIVDEDATGMLSSDPPLANPDPGPLPARVGDECGTDVGACSVGRVVCEGGVLLCAGAVIPHRDFDTNFFADICESGQDDDCDGAIDAMCDECPSIPETCNGRDDDCDGMVDEGNTNPMVDVPATFRPADVVHQCTPTPSIPAPNPDSAGDFATPFDDVAFSRGGREGARLRVGMAYREILPGGDSRIAFRILRLNVDCTCAAGGACGEVGCTEVLTPTSVRDTSDAIALSGEGDFGAPTIVYSPAGFRSEGDGGGWFVLWNEVEEDGSSSVMGRRVSEDDATSPDAAPFAATAPGVAGSALEPTSFVDGAGAAYAYIQRGADRRIVTARLTCAE